FWLGTHLSGTQIGCIALILAGVALALAPSGHLQVPKNVRIAGTVFGIIAALAQGGSAVISRKAYAIATLHDQPIDGITAAYQRIWGGVAITIASFLIWRIRVGRRNSEQHAEYLRTWRIA